MPRKARNRREPLTDMKKWIEDLGWRISGTFGPRLGTAYIRIVRRLVRWEWLGRPILDDLIASNKPFIVAFWHGRILMMAPVTEESKIPVHVVISANKDGELIARLITFFNGRTIRGSSRDPRKSRTKGGDIVLHTAIERLNAGEIVAITPDGPRGPRMKAQAGAAVMSIRTGVPVVPFAYSTRRAKLMRSWDKFMVPLPFGRGSYAIGQPIVPQGTDETAIEAHRTAIEEGLNHVTRQADEAVGRAYMKPV